VAVAITREELLRLLGPSFAELARDTAQDTAQRTVSDAGYAFPRAATVLSAADDDGTAAVHIDGDPDDAVTAITVVGQTVFEGQRILALFGGGSTYALGGLGEGGSTGGVDLSNYVTFADLNAFDFNAHVTPQRTVREWAFNGPVAAGPHKNGFAVAETEAPISAFAFCGTAPSVSPVTFQLDYYLDGSLTSGVLASNLTVPVGAQTFFVYSQSSFTLAQFTPGAGPGILRPRVVSAGNGTAQDITFGVYTQRV
jgi:hypothetical protein